MQHEAKFYTGTRSGFILFLSTLILTSCGGGGGSAGSTPPANASPTAGNVSIFDTNNGAAVPGDTLTGNYTYADTENDTQGASTFRWLLNGTAISGATSINYTLTAADNNQVITFEVTPVATTGTITGNAVISTAITVGNFAPTASGVNITGASPSGAAIGDSLTGNYSYADTENDAEGASTFQWLRNGTAISSATSTNYTLTPADIGQSISFSISPVAATGTTAGSAVTSSNTVTIINNPPIASNVTITGNSKNAGNTLTGNYDFADSEGDAEGLSTFRWLRNGTPISGATASVYTLIAADIPAKIIFEVTPVALTGNTNGSPVTSAAVQTGNSPVVSGTARYLDINANGINDTNDQIIIPFNQNVSVNSATAADFSLPVTGDSLGSGATVASGPASNEITITLGSAPSIKARQNFSAAATAINSASGIDVSASITAGTIQGSNGLDAVQSVAIDIIPAYVDSLQSLAAADDSRAIAVGDVDGDGDLDMVLANKDQANQVYKNNGNGTFSIFTQSTPLGSNDSRSIVLGDLDGDGDLDMVVANANQGNRIYLNTDGKGNFTDSGQSLGSNNSYSVALGDIDADGDLDMVVANFDQGNQVYKNNGNGTFSSASQSLGNNSSFSIALGDIDSDGDMDMVVANIGVSKIYPNDGSGNFGTAASLPGSNLSVSVALGDLNNDNRLDIVLINNSPAGSRVLLNNGSGSFSQSNQSLGGSNASVFGSLGDMDGDGDLDIVIANTTNGNRVYHNDGNGSFTDSGQPLDLNSSFAVALGDIDNDGDLDIMSANLVTQGNQVYLNSLSATWGSVTFSDSLQSLGTSDSTSVELGDVDLDGDLDMLVTSKNATQVYKNNGKGVFDSSSSFVSASGGTSLALGDVDGDGDLDAVISTGGTIAQNRIYLNNGSGTFTDSGQGLGDKPGNINEVMLGDVDNDGDLDIVSSFANADSNRVYLNNGSGIFSDSMQALGTNDSRSLSLGDIDNDGDLDIVVTNQRQPNRVYFNNGSGIFSDSGQQLGGNNLSAFCSLSDIDNDGDLDLLVYNAGVQANRVYFNNGKGAFTITTQSLGASDSIDAATADIDGDGDQDLVVANSLSISANVSSNTVYSNDGKGTFSTFGQPLGSSTTYSIAVGDLDNDGDLDIVEANRSDGDRVYLSQ